MKMIDDDDYEDDGLSVSLSSESQSFSLAEMEQS